MTLIEGAVDFSAIDNPVQKEILADFDRRRKVYYYFHSPKWHIKQYMIYRLVVWLCRLMISKWS
jgi:hypothetical protein